MFYDFLKVYWKPILCSVFLLASFILFCIKKKPTWNTVAVMLADVLQKIPFWISLVEHPGDGAAKLGAVLELVRSYLQKQYKFDNFAEIENIITQMIEEVLSAPQKKEV